VVPAAERLEGGVADAAAGQLGAVAVAIDGQLDGEVADAAGGQLEDGVADAAGGQLEGGVADAVAGQLGAVAVAGAGQVDGAVADAAPGQLDAAAALETGHQVVRSIFTRLSLQYFCIKQMIPIRMPMPITVNQTKKIVLRGSSAIVDLQSHFQ
jgi:hypothetical protein